MTAAAVGTKRALTASAVCVFFTLNRSFYPSTSSTTSVGADSSIVEEIQVLWPQSYAPEILRCHLPGTLVCSKHCSWQCNAMSLVTCLHTIKYGVDTTGTTYTFYEIEKRKERKRKQSQRRQIEREKEKRK